MIISAFLMSVYCDVTEQDLIYQRKLAEQEKTQWALRIENRFSKHAHDKTLAESFSPIGKKLDEVNDSTKNLGEDIKESSSENEKNQEIVPVEFD